MYTIHPLKVGESDHPGPGIFFLGDPAEVVHLFHIFFLIRGEGRVALVDTGPKQEAAGAFMPGFNQPPSLAPLAHLERLGLKPDQVTDIIVTHLHYDHFSSVVKAFPKASIHLNRQEWISITAPSHPWFTRFVDQAAIRYLLGNEERLHLTDNDYQIAPGLRVFWTGGHTPGSQAIEVQIREKRAVITGDVVFTYRNIEQDIPVGFNCNLLECFSAMERIRRTADIVLPCHEPLIFERYGEELW